MSNNLVENWSRYINMKNPTFVKRYCIDKIFEMQQSKAFQNNHPIKQWQACFDICVSRSKGYLYSDQYQNINLDVELMYEVEVLRTSHEVVSNFTKIIGNIKIILNSSVILDLFMIE